MGLCIQFVNYGFDEVGPGSIFWGTVARNLGLRPEVNVWELTAAVGLGGKTLSNQLAGIGSSAGSGVIGGGVTLAPYGTIVLFSSLFIIYV